MDATKTILIVEDEVDLAELVRFNLEREGHTCRVVHDGASALTEIQRDPPDLVLLDRMLPGISGDEVIIQMKRDGRTSAIPIVMLTAKKDEADELVGFALGATDYIHKPFSMKLIVARIAAILRRSDAPELDPQVLMNGPILLDASRHEVTVESRHVALTMTEFKLLRTLMAAGGRVLTRTQLIDAVMGTSVAVTDRTVDVHVTSLRKKLGAASERIQTIRGVGYAVRDPA